MVIISFRVLASPSDLIVPLDELKFALRAGTLSRFQALWGKPPGGDCHAVAGALRRPSLQLAALVGPRSQVRQECAVWCGAWCGSTHMDLIQINANFARH